MPKAYGSACIGPLSSVSSANAEAVVSFSAMPPRSRRSSSAITSTPAISPTNGTPTVRDASCVTSTYPRPPSPSPCRPVCPRRSRSLAAASSPNNAMSCWLVASARAKPPGRCHRQELYPIRCPRPLLQRPALVPPPLSRRAPNGSHLFADVHFQANHQPGFWRRISSRSRGRPGTALDFRASLPRRKPPRLRGGLARIMHSHHRNQRREVLR